MAMEKEVKNNRGCRPPEPDHFLQWGNTKRLRCVKVQVKDEVNERTMIRAERRSATADKGSSLLSPTAGFQHPPPHRVLRYLIPPSSKTLIVRQIILLFHFFISSSALYFRGRTLRPSLSFSRCLNIHFILENRGWMRRNWDFFPTLTLILYIFDHAVDEWLVG